MPDDLAQVAYEPTAHTTVFVVGHRTHTAGHGGIILPAWPPLAASGYPFRHWYRGGQRHPEVITAGKTGCSSAAEAAAGMAIGADFVERHQFLNGQLRIGMGGLDRRWRRFCSGCNSSVGIELPANINCSPSASLSSSTNTAEERGSLRRRGAAPSEDTNVRTWLPWHRASSWRRPRSTFGLSDKNERTLSTTRPSRPLMNSVFNRSAGK